MRSFTLALGILTSSLKVSTTQESLPTAIPAFFNTEGDFPLNGLQLPTNLTDECAKQFAYTLQNAGSQWTLQMLDSFAKPENGVLEGNLNFLGNWDECVDVHIVSNASIEGKYCTLVYMLNSNNLPIRVQFGVCVPSRCNNVDTEAIFDVAYELLKINGSGLTADCHDTRELDLKAIVAIAVFGTLAFFLVVSTLFDVVRLLLRYNTARRRATEDMFDVSMLSSTSSPDERTPLLSAGGASSFPPPLPPPPTLDEKAGTATQLLLAYSAYSNGRNLLSTRLTSESSLRCLHGLRFISMCWVVLGHTYAFFTIATRTPLLLLQDNLSRLSFLAVLNAPFAVDTFFLMSGFLVMFLILKELDERNGKFGAGGWIMLYVHRYIRLTPVYAFVLMVWSCLAIYFWDGPLWPSAGTSSSLDTSCLTSWWTNLLYINNLYADGTSSMCMLWTWYLANDMQFFIITPILAYITYRKWQLGVVLTTSLTLASCAASALITVENNLGVSIVSLPPSPNTTAEDVLGGPYFQLYYIKPWCRFQAYGVGLLLAVVLHKGRRAISFSLPVVVVSWVLASASCLSLIYSPYSIEEGGEKSLVSAAIYNGLGRTAWCIGVGWVILACCTNNGGWVNTLLSWRGFMPLSRLTYTAYLMHPALITIVALASRQTLYFGDLVATYYFLGSLVLAYAAAVVVTLLVETPLLAIEKIFIRRAA